MTPDRVATWTRPDGTHWKTINTADRAADFLAEMSSNRTPELVPLVAGRQ